MVVEFLMLLLDLSFSSEICDKSEDCFLSNELQTLSNSNMVNGQVDSKEFLLESDNSSDLKNLSEEEASEELVDKEAFKEEEADKISAALTYEGSAVDCEAKEMHKRDSEIHEGENHEDEAYVGKTDINDRNKKLEDGVKNDLSPEDLELHDKAWGLNGLSDEKLTDDVKRDLVDLSPEDLELHDTAWDLNGLSDEKLKNDVKRDLVDLRPEDLELQDKTHALTGFLDEKSPLQESGVYNFKKGRSPGPSSLVIEEKNIHRVLDASRFITFSQNADVEGSLMVTNTSPLDAKAETKEKSKSEINMYTYSSRTAPSVFTFEQDEAISKSKLVCSLPDPTPSKNFFPHCKKSKSSILGAKAAENAVRKRCDTNNITKLSIPTCDSEASFDSSGTSPDCGFCDSPKLFVPSREGTTENDLPKNEQFIPQRKLSNPRLSKTVPRGTRYISSSSTNSEYDEDVAASTTEASNINKAEEITKLFMSFRKDNDNIDEADIRLKVLNILANKNNGIKRESNAARRDEVALEDSVDGSLNSVCYVRGRMYNASGAGSKALSSESSVDDWFSSTSSEIEERNKYYGARPKTFREEKKVNDTVNNEIHFVSEMDELQSGTFYGHEELELGYISKLRQVGIPYVETRDELNINPYDDETLTPSGLTSCSTLVGDEIKILDSILEVRDGEERNKHEETECLKKIKTEEEEEDEVDGCIRFEETRVEITGAPPIQVFDPQLPILTSYEDLGVKKKGNVGNLNVGDFEPPCGFNIRKMPLLMTTYNSESVLEGDLGMMNNPPNVDSSSRESLPVTTTYVKTSEFESEGDFGINNLYNLDVSLIELPPVMATYAKTSESVLEEFPGVNNSPNLDVSLIELPPVMATYANTSESVLEEFPGVNNPPSVSFIFSDLPLVTTTYANTSESESEGDLRINNPPNVDSSSRESLPIMTTYANTSESVLEEFPGVNIPPNVDYSNRPLPSIPTSNIYVNVGELANKENPEADDTVIYADLVFDDENSDEKDIHDKSTSSLTASGDGEVLDKDLKDSKEKEKSGKNDQDVFKKREKVFRKNEVTPLDPSFTDEFPVEFIYKNFMVAEVYSTGSDPNGNDNRSRKVAFFRPGAIAKLTEWHPYMNVDELKGRYETAEELENIYETVDEARHKCKTVDEARHKCNTVDEARHKCKTVEELEKNRREFSLTSSRRRLTASTSSGYGSSSDSASGFWSDSLTRFKKFRESFKKSNKPKKKHVTFKLPSPDD